jgi:hypothetical protein
MANLAEHLRTELSAITKEVEAYFDSMAEVAAKRSQPTRQNATLNTLGWHRANHDGSRINCILIRFSLSSQTLRLRSLRQASACHVAMQATFVRVDSVRIQDIGWLWQNLWV